MIEILIDYDNLTRLDKNRGISNVVSRILSCLTPNDPINHNHFRVRLYGGWYNSSTLSTKAQNLSSEIQSAFPSVFIIPSTLQKIIGKAELAFSSIMLPREHLLDTYRIREFPSDLNCQDPTQLGCNDPQCPVKQVYHFFSGHIQNQCCSLSPEDILYRGQQKLVDTMLAIDLFYLSISNSNPIIVVTSDDDFWPSIRAAIEIGTKIIHVHTKRNRHTPSVYTQFANSNYTEFNL